MFKHTQIIVAKSAGFCPGVKKAIEKAMELTASQKKPIYTLGPLIHNTQAIEMLAKNQILAVDTPEQAIDKHGVLVIRAHGITPEMQHRLEACKMKIVDATCPLVKHAQNLIAKFAGQGYHTVIVGDKAHAEVIGLMGYASCGVDVVSNLAEAGALPHFAKVHVVSQTTQPEAVFYALAEEVKKHADMCQVSNTICQPTKDRQKETIEQARKADLVIVVGGKHSANTTRLAQLCQGLTKNVQHVETAEELDPALIQTAEKIFITAGASTPSWVIADVESRVKLISQS